MRAGSRKRVPLIVLSVLAVIVLAVIIWFVIPYSPLTRQFRKDVEAEMLDNTIADAGEVFTEADFSHLPEPVQKFAANAGYIGKEKTTSVSLEYHDVAFRQGNDGSELTIDYTQFNFADSPTRAAIIETSMFGIPFEGYDYYLNGNGGMKGVLGKVVTIFHETGSAMNVACLATFLAEALFLPQR